MKKKKKTNPYKQKKTQKNICPFFLTYSGILGIEYYGVVNDLCFACIASLLKFTPHF